MLEGEFGGKKADLRINSGFPWNGKVSVELKREEESECTLALRIPGGWEGYTVNGKPGPVDASSAAEADGTVKDGYLYLRRTWRDGDKLDLDFPTAIRIMAADSRFREDVGRAAVSRGPVVYCM